VGGHTGVMRIPRAILEKMVDHARGEWPKECCGLLAGKDRIVERIYQLDNREENRVSYLADPQQQFLAFKEMEDLDLELLAIYHSHPDSDCYPSGMDIEKAFYTDVLHIIISLKDPASNVKAFRIDRSGKIIEEKFEAF
jgi:proteasome lid subunit RPN8/RPN11